MKTCVFVYTENSRNLKKIIVAILKSGCASEVQKINYCQSFSLKEKKVEKSESKMILVRTEDENKLLQFITNNFAELKRINL